MAKELIKAAHLPKLLATKGKHRDGAGLFLQVAAKGQASWTYQFRFDGATHWMSIGPAATFTLTEAREAHHELRRQRDRGIDPRRVLMASAAPANVVPAVARALAPQAAVEVASPPFGTVVVEYLAKAALNWTGGLEGKEAFSYRRTLTGTTFAKLPVAEINTADVEAALDKFPPGRAEKIRMRIHKVLNFATFKQYRSGDNPARLKGHLEFAERKKPAKVVHHPAMAWAHVPKFMSELMADGSTEARALAFLILTAARTNEIIGAKWKEIEGNLWAIPAERMKGKPEDRTEHDVPLSPAALKLLVKHGGPEDYVFPSRRYGARKPLWHASMLEMLKTLRGATYTVHGFRSTFSDWAAEAKYSLELRERALHHAIGDAVVTAYQRSKLTEQRRPMMVAWAKFAIGTR
jgi:integrase